MIRLLAAAIGGAVLGCIAFPLMADENQIKKVHADAFQVVGIEARTDNAREATAQGVIPRMWRRLTGEALLDKIPNRTGTDVIVLYSAYESDKSGAYNYTLGAKVSSAEHLPPGMAAHSVPAGDYAVWTAGDRPAPDAVVQLWRRVWSLEDSHRIARDYRTDYEVHHFTPVGESAVELFIGLKK